MIGRFGRFLASLFAAPDTETPNPRRHDPELPGFRLDTARGLARADDAIRQRERLDRAIGYATESVRGERRQ